jgi:hypothetical protein
MGISDNAHKAAADAVVALGNYVGVFTGDSGTTGANEASGGGYARQASSFPTGAMSGGYWVRQGSQVAVPVAAGTYQQAGTFSAASGGNFVGADNFVGGSVGVSGSGASILVTLSIEG